jgi:hypothetical protein
MAMVLETRLREILREDLGGTYSRLPSVRFRSGSEHVSSADRARTLTFGQI